MKNVADKTINSRRYLMKNVLSKLFPFYLIIILFGCLHASDKKIELIHKAKEKYKYFGEFLNENDLNEKEILIVLNFMENPEKFFDKIKLNKINPNKTFLIFDRLGITDNEFNKYSYEKFLDTQFTIDKFTDKKIEIITFLMCQTGGYLGEILLGYYTNLFGLESNKFIKCLSVLNEDEWKKVASGASLDWETFKPLVEKLGDEGFEGKFKRYVLVEQFEKRKIDN
jgi:hypothetical protein